MAVRWDGQGVWRDDELSSDNAKNLSALYLEPKNDSAPDAEFIKAATRFIHRSLSCGFVGRQCGPCCLRIDPSLDKIGKNFRGHAVLGECKLRQAAKNPIRNRRVHVARLLS